MEGQRKLRKSEGFEKTSVPETANLLTNATY